MSGVPHGRERPDDDDVVSAIDALQWHREYIRESGFVVSALIVEAVLDDLRSSGPLARLLPAHVRFGDLVALRVMAAVHRLALERTAPAVALHLPTLGGHVPSAADRPAFAAAVVAALADHAEVLATSIAQTPQTNETGRAALLRCALSRVDPETPVRLREIGASAGLNLRSDHLPGLPGLEAGPLPAIVDRVGCDLHPIDPTTTEGRVTLSSYIWVDDVERFNRLRRAIAVAAQVPATVVTADAADFVETLTLVDGTTTVLWHSAFWLYLARETRDRILAAVSSLGAAANEESRFAYASWEWADQPDAQHPEFVLVMQQWPSPSADGDRRILAVGNSHGRAELAATVR